MTKSWRPDKGWGCPLEIKPIGESGTKAWHKIDEFSFELGADAMHKADVKWLIERIIHDDRGYVFKMSDREWQEFTNDG